MKMKEDDHGVILNGIEEMQALQRPDHTEENEMNHNESIEEPPLKRFKHLDRASELLQKKESEVNPHQLTNEEEEVQRYSMYKPTKDEIRLDPIVFWVNTSQVYPLLSPVVCDILSVSASSAPVGCTFSISGEASMGRRNRLVDYNLERETLLRKNKKYL